jgi:hypothetical protein
MKKSLWLLGPTVASERDVTKALLDVGFTVVRLSARIRQSDFDHPNFVALPAALTNLDAGKDVTGAADPSLRGWSVANRVTLS